MSSQKQKKEDTTSNTTADVETKEDTAPRSAKSARKGTTRKKKGLAKTEKKPLGRPSDYKPEYIDEVTKYLKSHKDHDEKVVKQSNPEKGYEMYDRKLVVKLPTIEGFARFIKVNKTTLYEWESRHPDFSNALDHIRTEQQERLINNGLSGEYNSTIAKLILSNNHGMREKDELPTKPVEQHVHFHKHEKITHIIGTAEEEAEKAIREGI